MTKYFDFHILKYIAFSSIPSKILNILKEKKNKNILKTPY